MKTERLQFLQGLKQFGEDNNREAVTRSEKMLNITADTGLMIGMLIRAWKPRRILEIGMSNGYSTIWWADAMDDPRQELVTLESNPKKMALAQDNFHRAGVEDRVTALLGDAGEFLSRDSSDTWDLIFLDADRSQYVRYWPHLIRILSRDGLLVVDKAAELEDFRRVVAETPEFQQVLVPIGNGELFIQRNHTVA